MDRDVLFQIRTRCESLPACLTCVGAVSSVDPLMSDKVADLREGFVASDELAQVGLLLVMHTLVLLQA